MSRSTLRRLLVVAAALVVGSLATAIPAFGADTFTPNPVNVILPAGGSTTVNKTLHLDALPGAADIIVAVDTTSSMTDAIDQAKAQANQLCVDVRNQIPGARFAAVDFEDYPGMPFGGPGDTPYLLLTPGYVADCTVFSAAIATMVADGGGDFAEAYNRVFYEAVNDPVLLASRNPDAVRFAVVLGDAPPHDATQTQAPSCGDRPPTDFGRNGVPGGGDDIETEAAIAGLIADQTTLLMIRYSNFIPLACYSELANPTGGTAVNAGADLSGTIIAQIQAAAAQIDTVDLVVSGMCPPVGITFNPTPPYGPFTAPVDINFTETITAPTLVGVYSCAVTAVVDGTPRAIQHVNVTVIPGPPATLTLAPKTATNTVDAQHCVTATVKDQFGNPTPGITVRFSVTGPGATSGARTTDANGEATFCYTSALPGSDVIKAFADTNDNGVQDVGEPSDTATKVWVLPTSTPGCKVTYGGRITAADGDKATFGGNAMVPASGPKGQEQYQDHGSAINLNVHSIDVLAVTCSRDGKSASIFGTATINGSGTFDFRIDVTDNGEPGAGSDTYRIRLSSGYDSGEQTLLGGNVQLH
ncbi:MAG TPA: post-COAP-1 domain-containing protein [Gaiellaceae bacterium]